MGIQWEKADLAEYLKRTNQQKKLKELIPESKKSETKEKKKPKYNNQKVDIDGIKLDSKAEYEDYIILKDKVKKAEIAGFCRQAEFVLSPGVKYKADWIVFNLDGTYEIRERKGFETDVWKIKFKLFKEKFPKLIFRVMKG